MNKKIDKWNTWTFPKDITFEDVSSFNARFEKEMKGKNVIFDLTDTVNMHSSFVGFLLHAKRHLTLRGNNLMLRTSFTVEKTLVLLNIMEYFIPETEKEYHILE